MATANDILNIARSQLGYRSSSTSSKYNTWYGMSGYWCAMFVSWVAAQASATDIIPRHAWTPNGANWFKNRGRFHYGTAGIAPGDIVYFNFGSGIICHVGIFEGWNAGRLVTIDGNTGSNNGGSGGCVLRRSRHASAVVGYGRPAYAGASNPTPSNSGIAVDGYWGPATTRALQQHFGTPIDGIISSQWPGNRQYLPRVTTATIRYTNPAYGSTVARALQSWAGTGTDGLIGPGTVKALQRKLGVGVDGYCGPATVQALQRWLNGN